MSRYEDLDTSYTRAFQRNHPTLSGELRSGAASPIDLLQIDVPRGETSGEASAALSIGLTLRGSSNVSIDAGAGRFTERCHPGYMVINRPQSRTHSLNDAPVRVLGLSVPWPRIETLLQGIDVTASNPFESLHGKGHYDQYIDNALRTLWDEVVVASPQGLLFTERAVDLIALRLIKLAGASATAASGKATLAPWQVRRVIEFLRAHVSDNVSLAMLAKLTGLSTFHFARGFKQSTGLPPHAYLRRIRIERARELLQATELPITEIAALVGYDTPQSFARMFRAETGTTPGHYRRDRRA